MEIIEIIPTSFEHLSEQLSRIIEICNIRNSTGFDSHTSYFHYEYHLGEEIGHSMISCPVCIAFNAVGYYTGDQLDGEFPASKKLGEGDVYPNVHETYPEMEKQCGCELELTDLSSACAEALADEIRMSVQ